jgi:hypothetical protein
MSSCFRTVHTVARITRSLSRPTGAITVGDTRRAAADKRLFASSSSTILSYREGIVGRLVA